MEPATLAGVDQDLGKVAAEDFEFGGRAHRVRFRGRELRHGAAVVTDESSSDFVRGCLPNCLLQTRAP